MRLFIPILCITTVVLTGCGKGKPENAVPVISSELLVLDSEGRAKNRDTGKMISGLVVHRNPVSQKIISSATFKDGGRNGISREFYPSGDIKTKAEFKNNKLHGNFGEWFTNGQRKTEGHFENGVPAGIFREWDETGKQEWKRTVNKGQLGERVIVRNEELKLSEVERKYLWDTEHHSSLLRKYGFKPFKAALLTKDKYHLGNALATILTKDFSAWIPIKNEGVKHNWGAASASRLEFDESDLKRVNRDYFVDWLSTEFSKFNKEPKIKLYQMTFAPLKRDEMNRNWGGRVKLRAWGKGTTGGLEELTLYMDWELNAPSESSLKAGHWLRECRISRRKHASSSAQLMREVASKTGLSVHKLHDNWKHGPDKTDTNTGGIFACDYNRDGITDLLITDKLPGPKPDTLRNYLFKGTDEGRMVDVTDEMGLGGIHIALACFADIDGDGWVDLISGQGRIYRNHDGQQFKETSTNLALAGDLIKHGGGSGITVADYDRDGKVDLYIFRNDVNRLEGTWVDGKIGPGAANQLLRNLGNWQFEDVTLATGTDGGRRSTFTSIWLDANNDSWPDLYVINEYGNGVLLVNQERGQKFKEMELTDRAADFGSMGLTAGDFNNDGNIDIYVASMYSKSGSRVIGNLRPDTYDADTMRKLQRMVAGSQLYRNLGGLKFEPTGKQFDVVAVGWAYGPTLADLDNDGFLDIHATTGFISRTRDKPDG